MDDNVGLKGQYPYDKIYSALASALADGILEQPELNDMLRLFKQVTDPVNENAYDCTKLNVRGKSVCLSGEFDCGSKLVVGERLTARGAKHTDYSDCRDEILLPVRAQSSGAWCAGKLRYEVRSIDLQAKGIASSHAWKPRRFYAVFRRR
jgi:hypothetical protein